jgi:hypothetical protein
MIKEYELKISSKLRSVEFLRKLIQEGSKSGLTPKSSADDINMAIEPNIVRQPSINVNRDQSKFS